MTATNGHRKEERQIARVIGSKARILLLSVEHLKSIKMRFSDFSNVDRIIIDFRSSKPAVLSTGRCRQQSPSNTLRFLLRPGKR